MSDQIDKVDNTDTKKCEKNAEKNSQKVELSDSDFMVINAEEATDDR